MSSVSCCSDEPIGRPTWLSYNRSTSNLVDTTWMLLQNPAKKSNTYTYIYIVSYIDPYRGYMDLPSWDTGKIHMHPRSPCTRGRENHRLGPSVDSPTELRSASWNCSDRSPPEVTSGQAAARPPGGAHRLPGGGAPGF